MSRLEALIQIRDVLKSVPAEEIGSGFFFYMGPCCSIGHAISKIPGAKRKWRDAGETDSMKDAAKALGIRPADIHTLTAVNDEAKPGPVRKARVLRRLDQMIEGET